MNAHIMLMILAVALGIALFVLNRFVASKFQYSFFGGSNLWYVFCAFSLFYAGIFTHESPIVSDILWLLGGFLIYVNLMVGCLRTTIPIGLLGALLLLTLFSIFSWAFVAVGIFVLPFVLLPMLVKVIFFPRSA